MRNRISQFLFWLGPVMAGFNVASHIVGFFGIGAVASWIIERWIPFTRWIWTQVIDFLNLPQIPELEKDALTTVFFFLPLGIWSLVPKARNDDDERFRVLGAMTGAFFLAVVGSHFMQGIMVEVRIGYQSSSGWLISSIILAILFFSALFTVSAEFSWSSTAGREAASRGKYNIDFSVEDQQVSKVDRIKRQTEKNQNLWRYVASQRGKNDHYSRHRKNLPLHNYRYKLSLSAAVATLDQSDLLDFSRNTSIKLFSLFGFCLIFLLFTAMFIAFFVTIGPIAGYCLLLTGFLSASSVVLSPYRIFAALGVVICFVVSGLFFDLLYLVIGFIEVAISP